MRRILALAAIAATLTATAACGGRQDPTVDEAAATSSTTATTVAGGAPPASETTVASSDISSPEGGDAAPAETVPDVVDVPPPPPGTPTYGPPEAGTYTYRIIAGQGAGQQTTTTIERLNDTDIRQTSPGFIGGGTQTMDLRFTGNEARLLRMVVAIPGGTREFVGDVLFAPIPPAGQWSWTLRSTTGATTVSLAASAGPAANTVTADITGREGLFALAAHLVIVFDLNTRMPTRIDVTSNGQTTSSEFVGFQPA